MVTNGGSILNNPKVLVASASILALLWFAAPAVAQAQPAQDPSASEAGNSVAALVEEVIVTGRKRAGGEGLQDVPLAVTALGEAQLEAAFVRDIENLSFSAPNVSLDSVGLSPGIQNFAIRGLGLNSSIPSIDPTVGLFVDEVYLGVTYGVVLDMFDLESVELLRGPQGLLFGRNVTGGAVLVRTKRPSGEFGGTVKAAVETGPEYILAGAVEGPLGSRAAARLAIYYKNDSGYFESPVSDDYGEEETFFVRPSLLLRPTDNSEVLLRYEHGEMTGDGGVVQNARLFSGFSTGVGDEGFAEVKWDQLTAEANIDVGEGRITNILAWRDLSHLGATDVDGTSSTLFHGNLVTLQEQWSNELRYSGPVAPNVNLTAGVFYFAQNILYREQRILANGALRSTLGGDQDQWTAAAFASADVNLTPSLVLNLGLRYTKEHKAAAVATFNAFASPCDFATRVCAFDFRDSRSWENWTPKVGLQWLPNDDLQLYAYWTKGVRSGGYNFRNTNRLVAPGPTRPETQDSFELGFKSYFAERRIRLNAAVFHNKIDGMQREIVLSDPLAGVAQVIRNSANATIQGFELEVVLRPTENFVLTGAAGYTDAGYDRVFFDLNADGVIDGRDRSLELPRVSPWTYSMGATYEMSLGAHGALTWRAQYSHRDPSAFTDANTAFLSEVDLVDASVSYVDPGARYNISIFGRNLTDEVYEGAATPTPFGLIKYLKEGRRYGAEITFKF